MKLVEFIKLRPGLLRVALCVYRFLTPFRTNPLTALPRYIVFLRDWSKFRQAGGKARMADFYPCLYDRSVSTRFDPHYFYQAVWAFRKILDWSPEQHVDVGSDIRFVAMLSAVTKVTFIDIRPLDVTLENFRCAKGSILALPYENGSVSSISSLHVIEHIGLGRYGDSIDPSGTEKACQELERVLQPAGRLYVSVPIGQTRVQFNGQKVFDVRDVLQMFKGLRLLEMASVDGLGRYSPVTMPHSVDTRLMLGRDYGLGMFLFEKPGHVARTN